MKVVQINCVYGKGSTGKIVEAIHKYLLSRGDESFVLYGMGKNNRESTSNIIKVVPSVVRKAQSFRSRITGYPYGGCIWGTNATISELKRIKPDIVHLQCANGYMINIYRILDYLKSEHIPTVITNHAEFMYTGGCTHAVECEKWRTGCYNCNKINQEHPISYFFDRTEREWKLFKESYNGFDKLVVCCVSDWVRERALGSPFFSAYPVITVLNGVNTDVFTYSDASILRTKLGLNGKKVVIHATPNFYDSIKGGKYVLEMARRFPECVFIIIGSEPENIVPNNCIFVGKIQDQKLLAQYYSMGDACLLTSKRETFSMVCAESLCCGTSVVGFKAGGPETIALPQFSSFVDQGNCDDLEEALKVMLEKEHDKMKISNIAKEYFGQNAMCNNYYNIYKNLI